MSDRIDRSAALDEDREELAFLTGAVRALVEALVETGASDLPSARGESVVPLDVEQASSNARAAPSSNAATASPREALSRREPHPPSPPLPRRERGEREEREGGRAGGSSADPKTNAMGAAISPAARGRSEDAPGSTRERAPASVPPPSSRKLHVLSPLPAPSSRVVAAGKMDPIARRVRLEELQREIAACLGCGLHAARTQTVFARGNPEAELMFVGEGPGADEDAQGEPFVGKAGQLLDKMIAAMHFERDDVYVANIVKCRPPENRKPLPEEIEACEGYLHEQIALVQPKVIVALGATAVEALLRTSGITKLRGTWRLYRGEIPVMPTFHPSYLLRVPNAKRVVWEDLQEVMRKLGK